MTYRSAQRKSLKRKKTTKRSAKTLNSPILKNFLIFIVFLLLSGFLGVFFGIKILNKRFASAESSNSYSIIDAVAPVVAFVRINDFSADPILVESADLIVFDKTSKKILKLPLNATSNVELSGKFGKENFSKVFALGSLDADNKILAGIESVKNVLFQTYGIEIRKYVFVDASNKSVFNEFFEDGNVIPLLNPKILTAMDKNIFTNLTFSEFNDLGKMIASLPEDRVVSVSNIDLADDALHEVFFESEFAVHADTIAVLNGSGVSGMAAFGARVIRNIGGRVVAINNSDSNIKESMIVAEDPENYSVKTLSRIFGIKKIVSKENARSSIDNNEIDRADILVFFGFDKN